MSDVDMPFYEYGEYWVQLRHTLNEVARATTSLRGLFNHTLRQAYDRMSQIKFRRRISDPDIIYYILSYRGSFSILREDGDHTNPK